MNSDNLKREAAEIWGPEPDADGFVREPMLTRLSDVQAEEVSWLWPSRLALGKISLLVGDPAMGKSFLTCALAAAVTTGAPWPDGSGNAPCGGVVLLNAEDGLGDTIKPRLAAAGADCRQVVSLDGVLIRDKTGRAIEAGFTLADMGTLEAAIQSVENCKLVVIDPVSAYTGSVDSHVNAQVRSLLKPLGDLAAKYRVAVVIVSHLNKSAAAAMYRTTGSLAFVAAARAAWCCVADKSDPTRRMMLSLKNNLAPDVGGMAYTIRDGMVQWLGRVEADLNEVMADARDEGDGGGALEDAEQFLRVELADGRLTAGEIEHRAKAAGHKKRTLDTAKKRLGIESLKIGPTWFWELPKIADAPLPLTTLQPCSLDANPLAKPLSKLSDGKDASVQGDGGKAGIADLTAAELGDMADRDAERRRAKDAP